MSDTIKALKENIRLTVSVHKADKASDVLLGVVVGLAKEYNPGEITVALIKTTGQVAAMAKPKQLEESDLFHSIMTLFAKEYLNELDRLKKEGS